MEAPKNTLLIIAGIVLAIIAATMWSKKKSAGVTGANTPPVPNTVFNDGLTAPAGQNTQTIAATGDGSAQATTAASQNATATTASTQGIATNAVAAQPASNTITAVASPVVGTALPSPSNVAVMGNSLGANLQASMM